MTHTFSIKSAFTTLFCLLICLLALSACKDSKYVAEYNQKLTLHVQTPDGPVSASAVTREKYTIHEKPLFATGTISEYTHWGEAVAIQLGDKWLFALLEAKQFRNVYKAIPKPAKHDVDHVSDAWRRGYLGSKYYFQRVEGSIGQVFDVPEKHYPMLVSFRDITNPASVFEVAPSTFGIVFGDGYALEKMTVQVTEAPVTEGVVEGVLGCIKSGHQCIPFNKELPYGHPMRNILNKHFIIRQKP